MALVEKTLGGVMGHSHGSHSTDESTEAKGRAAKLSLVVGSILMLLKFWAYQVTRSQAVLSDALESIINVLAAGVALFVIYYASKPADDDHPYGHGKSENFSSAFEGGLISFAGLFIVVEAIVGLVEGRELRELDLGLWIVAGAGLANLLLGLFLIYTGKKNHSRALRASGHHVISDFWTSAGILAALFLIKVTGLIWIDSAVAILVGAYLSYTGLGLIRESLAELMDQEDPKLLESLGSIISQAAKEGIIQVHHVRMIRSGSYHHIDAHVVVPQFWDIQTAHDELVSFEKAVISGYEFEGDMNLHLDPCRKAYCQVCVLKDCPIREEEFVERLAFAVEELRAQDEPDIFKKKGIPH